MKMLTSLSPENEAKKSDKQLAPVRAPAQRPSAPVLDDAHARAALEEKATQPARAKATVETGYEDLIGAAHEQAQRNTQKKEADKQEAANESAALNQKEADEECRKEIIAYGEGKAPAIGLHSSADIANATIAVFGEMTPGGGNPELEAWAICSCIFNRKDDVDAARAAYKKISTDPQLKKEIDELTAQIEGIKLREKNLKTKQEQSDLNEELKNRRRAKADKQGQINKAKTKMEQLASEFLGGKSAAATLSNVVMSGKNFGGYDQGKKYVNDVRDMKVDRRVTGKMIRSEMSEGELHSYCTRWRAAKKAVEMMAAPKTSIRLPDIFGFTLKEILEPTIPRNEFRFMFSNRGGKRKLDKSDVRIDGNDFSTAPMREHK